MGYTHFTVERIEDIIKLFKPQTVCDLGAQNMYNQPQLPAPYASSWYKMLGIDYYSIDINGENDSIILDLSKEMSLDERRFFVSKKVDMLIDAGTSEHVGDNGKFSWEAIYNCWKIKHDLLKNYGVMYSENPKTGNWPGHGFNYYTQDFYSELAGAAGYHIINTGVHPACNNTTDGWNVYCTLVKGKSDFITLEQFKRLPLKTS
jgi:hypothetical protein